MGDITLSFFWGNLHFCHLLFIILWKRVCVQGVCACARQSLIYGRVTLTSDIFRLRTLRVCVLKAEFLQHLLDGPWFMALWGWPASETSHTVLQACKASPLHLTQTCFGMRNAHFDLIRISIWDSLSSHWYMPSVNQSIFVNVYSFHQTIVCNSHLPKHNALGKHRKSLRTTATQAMDCSRCCRLVDVTGASRHRLLKNCFFPPDHQASQPAAPIWLIILIILNVHL